MFALQIYFDFSGYSDMAIGLGLMFGFHYNENFNYPYIALSVTDFWRRWHMSLGSFFRDYLYIPLGGNRKNYFRNIAVVWFLTGLWHGASWNFIIWGMYFGVFIILEKLFLSKLFAAIPKVFSHLYLIFIVIVSWVFFYFTDLSKAFTLLGKMFGAGGVFTTQELNINFSNNVIFVILALICAVPLGAALKKKMPEKTAAVLTVAINMTLLFVSTAMLAGESYNPFLYFKF